MAQETKFGIKVQVKLPFLAAVEQVTAALKDQGFGILTTIDVRATMKEKLDAYLDNYVILGACNPPLAHRALQLEPEIGLLLPCNVIVYESEDGSGCTVSLTNPAAMMGFTGNEALTDVAEEAYGLLQQVAAALEA
jgi:uncharacterized protein (DUF302 family)